MIDLYEHLEGVALQLDTNWSDAIDAEPTLENGARLLKLVREARKRIQQVEAELESFVADVMPYNEMEADGIQLIRRTGSKRSKWDSEALESQLYHLAQEGYDPRTGEKLDPMYLYRELLKEAVPFTASLSWRVTPLKALGIDPDEYCERQPGKTSVEVV